MTDQPKACRSTQHCAVHGFCHRCTPSLDESVRHLVKAISAAGITTGSGGVYAKLAATIRTAARQTTGQDDTDHADDCTGCTADTPCDVRLRAQSHADGEHELCDAECECTCGLAGPAFVPAGHYRDCPQYTKPAPAVGQPAEAHDTEARTRQLILNCLTGRAVCPAPRPVDEATGLLDAYRAAILTAAADRFAAFDLHTEAAALRRMAAEDER
ncbi:hypothetical protein ACWEP8_37220 [Streptomyces hydrogenans]